MSQTYSIVIDETQREALVFALWCTRGEQASLLADMLIELPKVEAESPGVVHGLCY
jgi:hypothetical protein